MRRGGPKFRSIVLEIRSAFPTYVGSKDCGGVLFLAGYLFFEALEVLVATFGASNIGSKICLFIL